MLKTKDLQFSYLGGQPLTLPDIHCNAGEHWLLLGQSGSGKTTLLHLLAGLRTPQQGSIWVGDQEMTALSPAKLDAFRGKNIGLIFQQAYFLRALTVAENLAVAQSMAGTTPDMDLIKEILGRLNIGHKMKSRPDQLSVGEQQRVAIARALVNSPSVILADEPTSALDDGNTDEVIALIREQAEAVKATLLIVTHDSRLRSEFSNQITLQSIG